MRSLAFISGFVLMMNNGLAADSIRLLDQAGVPANAGGTPVNITLADVAELEGDYAESLGDLVVGKLGDGGIELSVQLATVRRVLTEAQVNWADLSLRGRSVCTVSVLPTGSAVQAVAIDNDRAVTTREALAIDQANAGLTVSDLIIDELMRFNDAARDELEIKFRGGVEASDAAWLNRSIAVGRYEVDVLSRSGLGVVPVKVWRYDPAGTIETVTLSAEVARRAEAVVVLRQLRRGEAFTRENVGVRSVLLTSNHGPTLDRLDLVIGQSSGKALREGAVVRVADVAPDVLVRRGQLVTVSCVSGSLVVRTVATASKDGVAGDVIALRNPETRDVFFATVTGKQTATITTAQFPGGDPGNGSGDALASTEIAR
ncbi:MAG: flagellar basal body P-ring formation chaperone FlgA [Planctomycetota bacterium]